MDKIVFGQASLYVFKANFTNQVNVLQFNN